MMSNVFDVSSVLIQSFKGGRWLRVGYITEVTTGGLTSQEWTLLAGFDHDVIDRMEFSAANPADIAEVNAVAHCLGKTVVPSFSRDFADLPQGADNAAIEEGWKDRAAAILNATCVPATLPRQGTSLVGIKQISPNFKTAPLQNETPDLTLPWLKVIPFDYLNRPFTAEVWFSAGISLNNGDRFQIQSCGKCAPAYGPGRYTLIVAPAPPSPPAHAPAPPA